MLFSYGLCCQANCNPRKYCKVQLEETMSWHCPSCGSELEDLAGQLKERAAAEDDVLKAVNRILGYYCKSCGDFYGNDSLKESAMAA